MAGAQRVKKVAAATFLSKRNVVCGRRFSSVSAWSLCSRTADLQGTFSPEARKTRPGGKAAGYDKSQRACEPSDTSRDFFDSLKEATRLPPLFLLRAVRLMLPPFSRKTGAYGGTEPRCASFFAASVLKLA